MSPLWCWKKPHLFQLFITHKQVPHSDVNVAIVCQREIAQPVRRCRCHHRRHDWAAESVPDWLDRIRRICDTATAHRWAQVRRLVAQWVRRPDARKATGRRWASMRRTDSTASRSRPTRDTNLVRAISSKLIIIFCYYSQPIYII